uniref:Protein Wnt n=3 Tax=Macrostomum lignano TaxID=282301 RepID=A0A1I8GW05_9PLAT
MGSQRTCASVSMLHAQNLPSLLLLSLLLQLMLQCTSCSGFSLPPQFLQDAADQATVESQEAACRDLHPLQRNFCRRQQDLMPHIRMGVHGSLMHCAREFQVTRWNCSQRSDAIRFGLRRSTRETAFVQAVTSAGVTHSIAKACSLGKAIYKCLNSGTSLTSPPRPSDPHLLPPTEEAPEKVYHWSGCSDNIYDGDRLAARFMDATALGTTVRLREVNLTRRERKRRRRKKLRMLSLLHNNGAGRLTVCRCHGISGSCSLRSCWRVVPSMLEISAALRMRYDSAVKVSRRWRSRRLLHRRTHQPVHPAELVFWQRSPSYCSRNIRRGSLGTEGRECSLESSGGQSCGSLCCGRGHVSEKVVLQHKCHCRFHWCCEVRCQVCQTETVVHKCL